MSFRGIHLLTLALVLAVGVGLGWVIRSQTSDQEGAGACFLHYRISEASLRIQIPGGVVRTVEQVVSGNNLPEAIAQPDVGPIPPGVYAIYTRDHGQPTYGGSPAFILDPIDDEPANDRIDGRSRENGGGRFAFRIHGGTQTDGCLATPEIEKIANLLLPRGSSERFDIYSSPPNSRRPGMKRFRKSAPGAWTAAPEDGDWELFEAEQRIGLLWVTF